MSNLDGSSPSVLATFTGVAPYAMILHNNALYWTDRITQAIYRTAFGTGSTATSTYHDTQSVPYGMSLYESSRTSGVLSRFISLSSREVSLLLSGICCRDKQM